MKLTLFTIIFLIVGLSSSLAQDHYYFKKWKAKGQIETDRIILLMDTTSSIEGKDFNQRLGILLSERLTNLGITSSYNFIGEPIEKEPLVIEFNMIQPAYIKINTLGAKIPLCNRFEIRQLTKVPTKKNRKIETTLSISVDKEASGLKEAADALATTIYESIGK